MKPLFLITDGGKLRSEGGLVDVLAEALKGASGQVEAVILREQLIGTKYPALKDEQLLELAKQIREHCDEHGAKLILHTNEELYKSNQSIFSGLHFNRYSKDIASSSSTKGFFGYSAHNESDCLKAEEVDLDYAFLSPVFPPNSKIVSKILEIDGFVEIKAKSSIPLVALGGIDAKNVKSCAEAGANAVAVISSVMHSKNPALAAEEIVTNFGI